MKLALAYIRVTSSRSNAALASPFLERSCSEYTGARSVLIYTSGSPKQEGGMSGLGANDTKPVLRELVDVHGLDNATYVNYIHHARHSISKMVSYDAVEYAPDSPNSLLHRKLGWMLQTCREWKLPKGRTDVLVALAKACKLGMR